MLQLASFLAVVIEFVALGNLLVAVVNSHLASCMFYGRGNIVVIAL